LDSAKLSFVVADAVVLPDYLGGVWCFGDLWVNVKQNVVKVYFFCLFGAII